MAKAERNPAIEETITLTLSVDEAAFLSAVLDRVGGSPTNSPRRYAPPIISALVDEGVVRMEADTERFNRGIYFRDDDPAPSAEQPPETFELAGQTLRYDRKYRDSDGDMTEFRPGDETGTEFRWRTSSGSWVDWRPLYDGAPPYADITSEPAPETFEFKGQTLRYDRRYRDNAGDETEFRPGGSTGTEFRYRYNQGGQVGEWAAWGALVFGFPPYREMDAPAVETVSVYGQEFKAGTVYRDTCRCEIEFRNGVDGPEWKVGAPSWRAVTEREYRNVEPFTEES